jgi:predicted permease
MSLFAWFRSFARKLDASRTEAELQEELRSHIALRADDLQRTGIDRREAERRARLEFGGREKFAEEAREEMAGNFLDTLARDVRFSLRVLRKSPGFTLVAIATLAVAIGANAVVFGVLNGIVLRPLNVPHAQSLYGIEHGNEHNMYESYPDYVDLRDRNRSFDDLAGFGVDLVGLESNGNPVRAWSDSVTGNYFDVMRVQPYLGRFFHASDEHGPNSVPYIVLAYAYWQAHFQSDPGVVGRTVRVNSHPFTIIGVAPRGFIGALVFFAPDFFAPLVDQEILESKNDLDARGTQSVFMTLGHLRSGVTTQQAAADLNSIGVYLEKTYPTNHGATTFKLVRPGLYGNLLGSPVRAFLGAMMLLAGLILLAACANLGSLFAARASDRSREVALRLALGAARTRILRQLLTEAMLISLAGGGIGLWASVALLNALSAWNPLPRFPMISPVAPDANVYVVALMLAILSGVLFGIIPARQVMRADPYQIIKSGPGAISRRLSLRDLLLAVQIAICAVLVTSSMVALRGMAQSLRASFGFDPRNAMLLETDLNIAGYRGERVPEIQKRMIDALHEVPGVEAVGIVSRPPLNGGGFAEWIFTEQATDFRPANRAAVAERFTISPEYLRAAGTVLLAGRPFTWQDDKEAPRVALVNRLLARTLFGSEASAVGRHFKQRDGSLVAIAGVVEDGKYENLTEDPQPAVFFPLAQRPVSETTLVVRSAGDPLPLARSLQAKLRSLDPELPFLALTWIDQLGVALFPARTAAVALGLLGIMGAILSITGIFGMAAYSVSRRLKELGIRIAVGARPKEVLHAALGRALKLLAIGSAAGVLLGILASRVLASIVYQATPRDPLVLGGVVLAMLLVGLLATWIPAQRALSIDPLTLLREE